MSDSMRKKLGRIPGYLGIFMLTGFFAIMFLVALVDIPDLRLDLLDKMIVALITMLSSAITYHFNKSPDPPTEDKL